MNLSDELDTVFSSRGRKLVSTAREFAASLADRNTEGAANWSRATLQEACAVGLAGIEVPEADGGDGQPFSVRIRVAEELARADFGFAFALINHHGPTARIATHASAEAKARLLPAMLRGDAIGCTAMSEPGAGSDFGAIQSAATRVDGGWRLHGVKRWIGNAAGADLFMTFAQTGGSRDGIACFIVEAASEGFVRRPTEAMTGVMSAGVGGFEMHDCFVPDSHVLVPPGQGFARAMGAVNQARVHVAAMACGMVAASLDSALRHARSRHAFGKPLLGHQGVRWSLADVATKLAAMQLLTYRATRLVEAESPDAVLAAAMAKQYAAEHCADAITACIGAMGAIGMTAGVPLARHLAAAPAIGIADGTTGMMRERIGAILEKSH
jgi:acrylyl-CoA reductase (NADPH)